jgi:hypothetical protein
MSTRRPGGKGPGGKRKDGGRPKAVTSGPSEQSFGPASGADGAPASNGEPQVSIMSAVEFNARVARKAFDLFEQRGRHEGHDVEDWLEAERLVKEELLEQTEAQPQ